MKVILVCKEQKNRHGQTQKSYKKEYDVEVAEKILRKSKSWSLDKDSNMTFKDGVIIPKAKPKKKES